MNEKELEIPHHEPFVDEFLEHFGVKGMKWGVRRALVKQSKSSPKTALTGVTPRVSRDARRDAKEYARAKMFYGDGAGNRRKLIKAKVEEKSKRVPGYKKAFDYHSSQQDMSSHADKATKERKSADRNARNKQRAGAVARRLTGEMGTQAAFVAIAAGGIAFARSQRGQALMKQGFNKAQDFRKRRETVKFINDLFKTVR